MDILWAFVIGAILGVLIGQFSVWRHLHVPLDGKTHEWTLYIRECIEDRKLENRWFE